MGKRAKPEEIIAKLREVKVLLTCGETAAVRYRRYRTDLLSLAQEIVTPFCT